jgi:Icc protein
LGLNTDQSLHDVLELITEREPAFDYLVCTGDIASAGHDTCYRRFIDIIRHYFSEPFAWLPGNHDSVPIMNALNIPNPPESRVVELGNWLIVLLNSVVPNKVYGNFEASELDFLSQTLNANPTKHTIVMLHHQPVLIGSAWIDQYIVRNANDFFKVIDQNPQVKAVAWGHVHQDFHSLHKQIALIATPSTCVQFKPQCDDFTVDTLMPGYRWYELYDDGNFTTGVERVTGKEYVIDYKSAGY